MSLISPGLGTISGLSSLKSLTLGGAPAPGTNPMNPLQGQAAVTGIGQFISQIMLTSTLRKATQLLGQFGGTQGGDPSALMGQLTSMLGLGQGKGLMA